MTRKMTLKTLSSLCKSLPPSLSMPKQQLGLVANKYRPGQSLLCYAEPSSSEVLKGLFVPQLKETGATALAISLLGAMVMPYYTIESAFALTVAFLINISIISVSGSVCSSSDLSPEDQLNCKDLDLNKASFLLKMIISFELPFTLIPLLKFTSSKTKMGSYANSILLEKINEEQKTQIRKTECALQATEVCLQIWKSKSVQ